MGEWVSGDFREEVSCVSMGKLLTVVIGLLDRGWDSEVLFHQELGADLQGGKFRDRRWRTKFSREDILLRIVRDHVL